MRFPPRHAVIALTLTGALFQAITRAEPPEDFNSLVNYIHRSWTTADGLPGMVGSIAETPDGYLWLGTQHGIVRFDGDRMTTLARSGTLELQNETITGLLVDHSGNLWVGTYSGKLVRILAGRILRSYSTTDGLGPGPVTALFEDHRGRLWIAQHDGSVSELSDGRIRQAPHRQDTGPSFAVTSFVEDSTGHILIADHKGIFDVQGAQQARCTFPRSPEPPGAVSLLGDGEGGLWMGTMTGLYRCQEQHLTKVWPVVPSRDVAVWSLARDKQRGLWLGTSDGVWRLQDGAFESFRERNGLSADIVPKVFVDSTGNVWAGTWGGLDRLNERFIRSYSTRQGLSSNQVWSVVEDRRGQVWVGTNAGLDRITGITVQSVQSTNLPSQAVYATQEGPGGSSLWFATLGGLCHLDGNHLSVYGRKDGLPSASVNGIFWTRDGTLLVSPREGGVFTLKNGRFQPYLEFPETVHSFSEARDGGLWLSTSGRLLHVDHRRVTAAYGGTSDDYAFSLEDGRGRVWAGSWLHGLVCIRNNRVIRFDRLGRPFDDHVFHIFEDRAEQLWLATPHGLFRVSEQDLENYAEGKQKDVSAAEFGMEDGFPSTGCNGSEQNSGWTDRKGRFWIPTGRGLALVDPGGVKPDTNPPNTMVTQVQVDDRSIALTGTIEVPPEPKRIVFTYTGISWTAPHEVRFRYRLDGFDQRWIDAGANRSASYYGLPPGAYTFHVTARNRYGFWKESAPVLLRVTQPFYRALWFFVACGIVFVSSCALIYHWRIRELRARSRAALTERARMAREIHDTLLQGVAGASLVLEAIASSVEDTDARKKFDRALGQMQLAMGETRFALWDMRAPEGYGTSLEARISHYGQSAGDAANIRVTFDHRGQPTALDPDVERHIFQIVREAILNAIRHSEATEIGVTVEFGSGLLRLMVEDNGRGFDVANATSAGHWGLLGMYERAAALGGSCRVSSTFGKGTTVLAELEVGRLPRSPKGSNAKDRAIDHFGQSHG